MSRRRGRAKPLEAAAEVVQGAEDYGPPMPQPWGVWCVHQGRRSSEYKSGWLRGPGEGVLVWWSERDAKATAYMRQAQGSGRITYSAEELPAAAAEHAEWATPGELGSLPWAKEVFKAAAEAARLRDEADRLAAQLREPEAVEAGPAKDPEWEAFDAQEPEDTRSRHEREGVDDELITGPDNLPAVVVNKPKPVALPVSDAELAADVLEKSAETARGYARATGYSKKAEKQRNAFEDRARQLERVAAALRHMIEGGEVLVRSLAGGR